MVTIKNKTKHKVPTDQFHFCKFLTYLFHMPFPASLQDLLKNINNNKIRPSFFFTINKPPQPLSYTDDTALPTDAEYSSSFPLQSSLCDLRSLKEDLSL